MNSTTAPASTASLFEQQHEQLDAQLHAHLLDVIGGDFEAALQRLQLWRTALARHIDIENTLLLPHIPEGARWAERVYRVEHDRIALLADEYLDRVRAAARCRPQPQDGRERREAILALVDSAHALRHVLEHHHEREHTALAHELPLDIQLAAWSGSGPDAPESSPD
ncbi:hypothetical protein [Melaminivora jejuensis]|uniref:hypothetical protein n=1 Tax=Melaminivora jejuensis TaxID=1267217 RepID=UPI001ADF7F8F|nr:hypothetical protein [Melaminivora jejuensis]UHJ65913.1 hypothetical protein LVC68_05205 [Melaminivora jejuensis]